MLSVKSIGIFINCKNNYPALTVTVKHIAVFYNKGQRFTHTAYTYGEVTVILN